MKPDHSPTSALTRTGPLTGVKIVEFTGIGPVPYAAMVLADLGAEIIRIDRPGGYPAVTDELDFAQMQAASVCNRSRASLRVDMKSDEGLALVRRLAGRADALIEGYRPGTMEKLGLAPELCLSENPALVYARMTGWGQTGPMAAMAGHDMNYLAISGALSLFARDGVPPPGIPPLLGDMAGGALFLVIGVLAGILQARVSGRGQVVDAAIVDGSANLMALLSGLNALGLHSANAGANMLDGGRHFYRSYRCADGKYVVVGAIEPAFRKVLLDRLGLADDPDLARPDDENDAICTEKLAAVFLSRPRAHWQELFDGSDGCVSPVLDIDEAPSAPQNRARGVFTEIENVVQPQPAPRFSETPGAISKTPREASASDPQALSGWGIEAAEIEALQAAGTIG